jgi:hypothetical protein
MTTCPFLVCVFVAFYFHFSPLTHFVSTDIRKRRLVRLKATMPVFEALSIFQTGKSHLAGVLDENDKVAVCCFLIKKMVANKFVGALWECS